MNLSNINIFGLNAIYTLSMVVSQGLRGFKVLAVALNHFHVYLIKKIIKSYLFSFT